MCRKRRYTDKEQVKLELIRLFDTKGHSGLRYYWCNSCKAYHITSQEKNLENKFCKLRKCDEIKWIELNEISKTEK